MRLICCEGGMAVDLWGKSGPGHISVVAHGLSSPCVRGKDIHAGLSVSFREPMLSVLLDSQDGMEH